MNTTMKNVLGIVLVAVVSSGLTIGANAYMNRQHANVATADNSYGFNQPLRLTNYSGVAAENTDFTMAAERSVHAVVHIKSVTEVQVSGGQYMDPFEFFFGNGRGNQPRQPQKRVGAGSGVIISTDGYIITNNHVIDGASELEVTLNDNRKFKAKVIGSDPSTDIALIKVDAKDLPTIPFGDSEQLKVGEWVLAVGNPFNLTSTVTAGIVSAKGRSISTGSDEDVSKIQSFIQTDAAVNPGNSGGALVNTKGELVGINTAIYSETGNFAGYSFAVPMSIAGKVVQDLKQYGNVQRAILGVSILDVSKLNDEQKKDVKVTEGAWVGGFAMPSSAKDAGVEIGDVIVAVNDVAVRSTSRQQEEISKYRPGDKVKITVNRKGVQKIFNIELRNMQGNTKILDKADPSEVLGGAYQELSDKRKRELGVNYGIEVTGVTNGKLKDAGIKKGYIIMLVNDEKISTPEDLERIVDSILKGRSSEQGLFIKGFYPNGKTTYYAINLSE